MSNFAQAGWQAPDAAVDEAIERAFDAARASIETILAMLNPDRDELAQATMSMVIQTAIAKGIARFDPFDTPDPQRAMGPFISIGTGLAAVFVRFSDAERHLMLSIILRALQDGIQTIEASAPSRKEQH